MKIRPVQRGNNYIILWISPYLFLVSYDSVVAKWNEHQERLTLGKDWAYSNTTSRHLSTFLATLSGYNGPTTRKELERAIEAGTVAFDPEMK